MPQVTKRDTNYSFEKELASFSHNSEHLRHLNSQMNHVPIISISLTGGLWYAVSLDAASENTQFLLLIFAAICNVCFIAICLRIRDVLQSCLEQIESFHPGSFANGQPAVPILGLKNKGHLMISSYTFMMFIAAIISYFTAFNEYWQYGYKLCSASIIFFILVLVSWLFYTFVQHLKNRSSKQLSTSITEYYDKNSEQYFNDTKNVDMSHLYSEFTALLPKHAKILDAGSGSGRDTLEFHKMGYDVTAVDSSKKLAKLSTELTGVKTKIMKLKDINDFHKYDGIWASASLLHLPPEELCETLSILATATKTDGVIYASFKSGTGQRRTQDGRYFTDMNEQKLKTIIGKVGNLKIIRIWISEGEGKFKGQGQWFNAILAKH